MAQTWLKHERAWSGSFGYATPQTNEILIASPGPGLSRVITWLVLSNGATPGNIALLDGSGGDEVFEIYAAINGGVALSNISILLSLDTLLALTSVDVTTHVVTVGGYVVNG